MTKSRFLSLILVSLCGALLQCSPNHEPCEGKTEGRRRAVEAAVAKLQAAAVSRYNAEDQLAALRQAVQEEKAAATNKIQAVVRKLQAVVRKRDAENKMTALRQAAEAEAKRIAEVGVRQVVGESTKIKVHKRKIEEVTADMTRAVFRKLDNNGLPLAIEGDLVEEKEVERRKATEEKVKSLQNDLEKLHNALKLLESKMEGNRKLEEENVRKSFFVDSNRQLILETRKNARDAVGKKKFGTYARDRNTLMVEVIREESEDAEEDIKIELDEAFEKLKQKYEKFEAGPDKENETLQKEEELTELRSMYKQLKKRIKREDEALMKRFEELKKEGVRLGEKMENGNTTLEAKLVNRGGEAIKPKRKLEK